MDAAVLHTFGKPPRFEQFPDPAVAGEGEVLVHVRAAALKPVEKQLASGTHYAIPSQLPVVCGVDGIGYLDDGTRVFFGGPRSPYGAMAQRTVVARSHCFQIPEAVDDATAAALANPGVSAWLTLTWRAKLIPGETVLVHGATGVTGKLAVQIAKLLGAGRVIAAGRNDLRHNYGSSLIQAGASLAYVHNQMGHSSIQVTVDIHGHLIPGANVAFVDKLDGQTSPQQSATQPQQQSKLESDGFKEVLPNEWLGGRDSNPDTQIQSLHTNFYAVGLLCPFPRPASRFCMVF